MSHEKIMKGLTQQLALIDKGMEVFEKPLDQVIVDEFVHLVSRFGADIVPLLHESIQHNKENQSLVNTIRALRLIKNPNSVSVLIELHRDYSNYLMGTEIALALSEIATSEVYAYFVEVVDEYTRGNPKVVNSRLEISIMCRALGNLKDTQSVTTLMGAMKIRDSEIFKVALESIIQSDEGLNALREKLTPHAD